MNDFFSKIKDSFKGCGCWNSVCSIFSDEPVETEAVKMSALKLMFRPFGIFVDKIKELFLLSSFYALLVWAVTVTLGFAYVCSSPSASSFFYCSHSNTAYFIYSFIKLYIIAAFLRHWFNIAFRNGVQGWKSFLLLPSIKDLQTTGVLAVYILLNLMPVVSFYMLYMRVPNPDWVVETAYFAVVSLGFFVPFVVMRFYSMFAFFLSGEKIPSFKRVWSVSKGNNLRIIMSLFLILVILLFTVSNFYRSFQSISAEEINYVGLVSEYLYNLIFLMLISLLVNNCYVQKELLFGDKTNGTRTDN